MLGQMVEYTSQPWEGEAREPTKVCSTVHVLKQSWSREVAEKEKERRKSAQVKFPHRDLALSKTILQLVYVLGLVFCFDSDLL